MSTSLDFSTKCLVCEGMGLVATPLVVCQDCEGKGCSECKVRESGFDQVPWSECSACIGTGCADQNVARASMGLEPTIQKPIQKQGGPQSFFSLLGF